VVNGLGNLMAGLSIATQRNNFSEATSALGAKAMTFSGPITGIGNIKPGSTPRTGADPKCLTIEVRTPTTMGQFVDLEISRDAIADLVAKLTNFLKDPDVLNNPNILK
jgi:hypothetical protein